MILHPPFAISARLLPALQVGGATLSLGLGRQSMDGRTQYECWIDLPDGTEHDELYAWAVREGVQE